MDHYTIVRSRSSRSGADDYISTALASFCIKALFRRQNVLEGKRTSGAFTQEWRQPVGRVLPALRLLQLLPDSQNPTSNPGHGVEAHGSRVGSGGTAGVRLRPHPETAWRYTWFKVGRLYGPHPARPFDTTEFRHRARD